MCEQAFPRIRSEPDYTELDKIMEQRNDQLKPTDEEMSALVNFNSRVVSAIEKVKNEKSEEGFVEQTMDPSERFDIIDYQSIGSFTRECMLRTSLKADIA